MADDDISYDRAIWANIRALTTLVFYSIGGIIAIVLGWGITFWAGETFFLFIGGVVALGLYGRGLWLAFTMYSLGQDPRH